MCSATGVEPTKLIACTRGSASRESTASRSPLTTFSTPSGRPASVSSSASTIAVLGSFSEGFSTKVLPQMIAIGNIHIGTMAGKLKGVMPATTPSGWNSDQLSMAGPTSLLCSPFRSSGAPQAYSTTSMPRASSPRASSSTLPCSAVISATMRSALRSSKSLKRNMMRARLSGVVARQPGKAATAAATATDTSSREAAATSRTTSPVAGFMTGSVRPVAGRGLPATKCGTTGSLEGLATGWFWLMLWHRNGIQVRGGDDTPARLAI